MESKEDKTNRSQHSLPGTSTSTLLNESKEKLPWKPSNIYFSCIFLWNCHGSTPDVHISDFYFEILALIPACFPLSLHQVHSPGHWLYTTCLTPTLLTPSLAKCSCYFLLYFTLLWLFDMHCVLGLAHWTVDICCCCWSWVHFFVCLLGVHCVLHPAHWQCRR